MAAPSPAHRAGPLLRGVDRSGARAPFLCGDGAAGYARSAVGLLALNYAWALVDPDRQFLHDRIAGTRLVLARPGP